MNWPHSTAADAAVLILFCAFVSFHFIGFGHAQSSRLMRIGVIAVSVRDQSEQASAFRSGLREAGYVEGRDVSIDWWYGQSSYQDVEDGVATILRRNPDVIVVEGLSMITGPGPGVIT